MVGAALTDAAAFANCYTVLRPVYDPTSRPSPGKGAVLITDTTVLSLIRRTAGSPASRRTAGDLCRRRVHRRGRRLHLVAAERLERVPDRTISRRQGRAFAPGKRDRAPLRARHSRRRGLRVPGPQPGRRRQDSGAQPRGFLVYQPRQPFARLRGSSREPPEARPRRPRRLFEWLRGLPAIADLTAGGLSSYAPRSSGAAAGATGPCSSATDSSWAARQPASASTSPSRLHRPCLGNGTLLRPRREGAPCDGRPFDAEHLDEAYLAPLMESVYGRNARSLSAGPATSAAPPCSSAGPLTLPAVPRGSCQRQFVSHSALPSAAAVLAEGFRELIADTLRALGALGLAGRCSRPFSIPHVRQLDRQYLHEDARR